ncbi:MAG TPA: 8-amino-7-oxononanoate synthase [Novosphingobium sp.]|nr:8-amino-7-oxononanoate synthase [Novosphingobium sp.]
MGTMDHLFSAALDRIRERGQHRVLRATQLAGTGRVLRGGRSLIDFSSNDYLGLATHPEVMERAREWTSRYGAGSGASRLVTGTSEAHLALEAKIAAFKGTEAALLFASGWQANAAVIPALLAAAPGAVVFTDRLNHASLHHGCAAAGVRQVRFRHNDLEHLETLLSERGTHAPARLILTESVFSMDGDRADLARLVQLARRYDAFLFVDEAHATGVLGPGGAGLAAGLAGVDLAMGTFSKAMGGFGAYVAGSELLHEFLVNTCSSFIFSTSPPPGMLGAIDAALDLVPGMEAERTKLAALGDRLRAGLRDAGYDTGNSSTQIVPAMVGPADRALALSVFLADRGMLAAAIRPPTVPAGTSRLRIALRSTHAGEDIDTLVAAIREFPQAGR